MITPHPPKRIKHIAELESIRGLAALLVALFHSPGWYSNKHFIPIIANGYLMVDLFFVISGFVIFNAYFQKINNANQFWQFIFLRFGRLYPVHFFILLYMVLAMDAPYSQIQWQALFQQLLLLQAIGPWGHPISFNFPAWSISVEFYTYVFFGFILVVLGKKSLWIFFILTLLSLWNLSASTTTGLDNVVPGFSLLWRCWTGFFIGTIGAYIIQNYKCKWPANSVTFFAILLIAFLQYKPNGLFDPLIYLITIFLIISITYSPMGVVKKILLLPPLKWLGKISYSLYMVQIVVNGIVWSFFQHNLLYRRSGLRWLESQLNITFKEPSAMLTMALIYLTYILALLITSWILFTLVEKPFRKLSRKVIHVSSLKLP